MDPDHTANRAPNRLCHLSTAESKTNTPGQLCFLVETGSRQEDVEAAPPVAVCLTPFALSLFLSDSDLLCRRVATSAGQGESSTFFHANN